MTVVERIEKALTDLRPFLEADQGDITLVEVTKDNIAKVELHGACSTCQMSAMTLRAGVEESIKKVAPEIRGVVAINALPVA